MSKLRLRHVAKVNPPTPEFDVLGDDEEVSFVPLERVWPNAFDPSELRPKHAVASGYTRFRDGDIVVPKITPTFQADRTLIVRDLYRGVGAGTTELHVVRPGEGVEPRFVRYLLSTTPFLRGGVAEMIGVAGQKRVPETWLLDTELHISDRGRQRRIADFLDAETSRIDTLITAKQQMIRARSERMDQVAYEATSGGRPARLGRLVVRMKTGSTPNLDVYGGEPGGLPWYSPGDFSGSLALAPSARWLSSEAVSEGGVPVFDPGSVLIVGIGATAGKVAVLAHRASGNQQITAIQPADLLDARFLAWFLRARANEVRVLAPYTTMPILNNDYLRSLRVGWRPVVEQRSIADGLDLEERSCRELVRTLDHQIDLLRERRQALITAAVTGDLVV